MRVDEFHGPFGVLRRELRNVRIFFDDLIAFDQGQGGIGSRIVRRLARARPHVVGIGQAEILVEAVMCRQKLALVTQVPLAEDGRVITALFEDLSKRPFVIADADPALRPEGS